MKKILLLLVPLIAAGCAVTPVRRVAPVIRPLRLADKATVESRVGELRALLTPLAYRGAVCYPRAVMASDIPLDFVFTRVGELGFNRLCARISSEKELNDELRAFLEAAHYFNMSVELVISQGDFFPRPRGNRLLRQILPHTPDLIEAVGLIAEFNASLPPEHRIAGVTVFIEPQRMTIGSPSLPHDAIFAWSDKTYGPGLDNDLIVRAAFDMLRRLPEVADGLPLAVAVPDFLHEKTLSGELSIGKISDFCAIKGIDRVIVVSSGNRPTQLVSEIANELKDAPAGAKIVIAVPVAEHFSVAEGALRRRDWKDYSRALGYLIRNTQSFSAFDGVAIGPLAHLQFMLNEKD